MRLIIKALWHVLAICGLIAVSVGVWLWIQGPSARTTPGPLETSVARKARSAMIPASAKARPSPEPPTSERVRAGLEHWADHCASCHGNDGSGATEIGQGLYPRAPDMRLATTQNLTDGELFYIIENGVKLTGMPAWATGTPDGELASWHLVQFIRKLPTLTEAELAAMEDLNPRGPAAWRALEDERRFLAGETPLPPVTTAAPHSHKGESR